MRKNGFLTFCFALAPGFGQMYQGYMRRGLSLLAWFSAIVFISASFSFGFFAIFLPIIWAYSFFDTFNIRALTPEQRAAFGDDYIPNAAWLKSNNLSAGRLQGKSGKIAGWVSIGIGVILLYNTLISPILYRLTESFAFLQSIIWRIPSLALAILVIFLGLRLLKGPRQNTSQNNDDNSVFPFNGQAPPQESFNSNQPPFDETIFDTFDKTEPAPSTEDTTPENLPQEEPSAPENTTPAENDSEI